jgi:NAD-dependent SIR2 family protein deacetylase
MNVSVNQVIDAVELTCAELNAEATTLEYHSGVEDFRNKMITKIDGFFIVRECRACKNSFDISKGEADWLKEKGLHLFTHCAACREKRKEAKLLAETLTK